MDYLAPLAELVLFIVYEIEIGHSVRSACLNFTLQKNNTLVSRLLILIQSFENGENFKSDQKGLERFIFMTLWKGFEGYPILKILKDAEVEILLRCREDLEAHLEAMPFKLLLPLLLLAFPAFLIVTIFPITHQLSEL